ncbi:hypothetical protein KC318_g15 [Hortaea werneckii]|nr:hypothetical protein KC334_g14 [Hortaea werneckii]KAI7028353.1 hypothetical protein KC355_g16 [Hortaea werneckii]KAI7676783.1 hypothetical protein KC318_g15 [Hortaea werneckii]
MDDEDEGGCEDEEAAGILHAGFKFAVAGRIPSDASTLVSAGSSALRPLHFRTSSELDLPAIASGSTRELLGSSSPDLASKYHEAKHGS